MAALNLEPYRSILFNIWGSRRLKERKKERKKEILVQISSVNKSFSEPILNRFVILPFWSLSFFKVVLVTTNNGKQSLSNTRFYEFITGISKLVFIFKKPIA